MILKQASGMLVFELRKHHLQWMNRRKRQEAGQLMNQTMNQCVESTREKEKIKT